MVRCSKPSQIVMGAAAAEDSVSRKCRIEAEGEEMKRQRKKGLCESCNGWRILTSTKTNETKEGAWGLTLPVYKKLCQKCISGLKEKKCER